LLDNLSEGSKVAIITSRVGSIEDNSSGGNYGYRASKTAVNMVGINLMHDLKPQGIAVALLHPGLVATDMTGGMGIDPGDSARGTSRIAVDSGTQRATNCRGSGRMSPVIKEEKSACKNK
jgi:NAD(P)-dependent dehydrogenase (short-subunit alcohol dehydrogenase family)